MRDLNCSRSSGIRPEPAKRNSRYVVETEQVFKYLVSFKTEHDGVAPTLREIQDALDLSSISTVCYHLNKLEAAGRIRREFALTRHIRVVGGSWRYEEEAGATEVNHE